MCPDSDTEMMRCGLHLQASAMSHDQPGSFRRYALEKKYAKIWQQQLPASATRYAQNLTISGAQLANCWSDHALLFLSERRRMFRLIAHAQRCVAAICTCAPEHLESIADSDIIDINEYVARQLLQQPPQPTASFRQNWRDRTSVIFSERLQHLQQQVQEFTNVFKRCRRHFARNAHPDIHFIPPDIYWKARLPVIQGQRVCWTFYTIQEWTCTQLSQHAVQQTPAIHAHVTAVRAALMDVRDALRALSLAVDVFIYLEWRALARFRTLCIVRRIMDQISKGSSVYRNSNLSVPDGIAIQVTSMLVGEDPLA